MPKLLRITEGRFKGRALLAPASRAVRPTLAKNREALFNILRHGEAGLKLEGLTVLDIYAGAGTLGFEALSRGAARVIFLEKERGASAIIRQNAEALHLEKEIEILARDASKIGKRDKRLPPASLLLADPPYGAEGLGESLEAFARGGWLQKGAHLALEEDSFSDIHWKNQDFTLLQSHRSGRAHFRVWKWQA